MFLFFAHAGEEHSSASESLSHQVASQPLIGILIVSALVCIAAALVIVFLGRSTGKNNKPLKPQENNNEKNAEDDS